MLSLLLAASVGFGVDYSRGLGEQTSAFLGSVRHVAKTFEIEASGAKSAKLESGSGWLAALDADVYAGSHGLIGLGWHHRDGGAWTKDRAELRAGVRGPRWRVTLGSLLSSRDRQSSAKYRALFPVGKFEAEFAAAVILYDQGALRPNRQFGTLIFVLLRYGH
jgi:hypothetical protein